MLANTCVLLVTCPDSQSAESIAMQLLKEKRVACVNLIPRLTSLYMWDGALQRDEEVLMLIKTTSSQVDAIEVRLNELHPYDVFECLSLRVASGSQPYLDWVHRQVVFSAE